MASVPRARELLRLFDLLKLCQTNLLIKIPDEL